jgi:DNA-binding MarR family transcriptional regulator
MMMRAKKHIARASEAWQLTPVQGMLLLFFKPSSTYSMNELAELMCCDASNITGLIDKLETHGYIERAAGEDDRRVKQIKLTANGVKCRQDIHKKLEVADALDLSNLSQDEIRSLYKIMGKIV